MDTVLFIDANIWLDFYRMRKEVQKTLLGHLESQSGLIVTTNQIEMEYKKHRQSEMVSSIKEMKAPEKMPIPPIMAQHQSAKAYRNALKKVDEKVGRLKLAMENALLTPSRSDAVYKVAQRIFHQYESPLNLHRGTKCKNYIRRLAFRRFIMGYPPRKKNDTSIGDAINWEWLVHVCSEQKSNAIIVSRDGDFGVSYNSKNYINDWLAAEFSDRVSKKKKVTLYDSLSVALKDLKVRITTAEIDEELRVIRKVQMKTRRAVVSHVSEDLRDLLVITYGDNWEQTAPIDQLVEFIQLDEADSLKSIKDLL